MNQYVTGTIIKELREKNKMTQRELSEKLGVPVSAVTPDASAAYEICEILEKGQ